MSGDKSTIPQQCVDAANTILEKFDNESTDDKEKLARALKSLGEAAKIFKDYSSGKAPEGKREGWLGKDDSGLGLEE